MRGTIAKVLNKVLGDFIEGINADDFQFKMTTGRVELSNLRLKKELFHTLNLPVQLVASFVGSLTLDIPFQSLKTKPIVVELSQVYATLAPSADIDPKITRRRNLEAHDKAWAAAKDETDDDKTESKGMAAKYLQKIMDNIQITIQDVHVRYEDAVSSQRCTWERDVSSAFAAGVTIDSIELSSFYVDLTTGEWKKKYVEKEQRFLNKMLTIGQFLQSQSPRSEGDTSRVNQSGIAVYINAGEPPYADPGSNDWISWMWHAIARDGCAAKGATYAFGPMSMELHFSIDKESNKEPEQSRVWHGEDGSSNEAQVHFTGIETHLRQQHASIASNLVSWMQNIYRWREFDERPDYPPSLGINAREWWKFAGRCIVERLRKQRKTRDPQNIRESLHTIKTYVSLYERHSRNGRPHLKDLTEREEKAMTEIEDSRSFETIVACRTVAWNRLLIYDLEQEKKGQPRKMTLAQIEMVDRRVAFKLRGAIEFKPDVSWAKVKLQNEYFAFELSQQSVSLLHLVVDKFSIEGHMFGNGGGGAAVCIHGLTVHDKFTHNPIFPHIIQRHDSAASDKPVLKFQVKRKISNKVEDESETALNKTQQTVLVQLEMQPLQIVASYNMLPVLQNFADFHYNDADLTETKLKAVNKFYELYNDYMMQQRAATENLEVGQAIETRMTINLNIGGPVFCLPQRFTVDDVDPNVFVIDTGRITLTTSSDALGDYDVSKVLARGAEVYYCPTNTYFSQHKQLFHLWWTYDEDKSGTLSMDEVCKLVRELSRNAITEEEIRQHMQSLDEDQSGEVDFGEFSNYFRACLYAEWLWSQADANNSGSLDPTELKGVLHLLGKRTTDAGFLKMWTALDADNSGMVEKNEFMQWWKLSGQYTGQKMAIIHSATLRGDVSICTKFDPALTKIIGNFQFSCTEIRISDIEVGDLAALFAEVFAATSKFTEFIETPEPSRLATTTPDAPSQQTANKLLMGSKCFEVAFEQNAASPSTVKDVAPTTADVAQRALTQWKLMDLVVHVEDLHIVLSEHDALADIIEVHLLGLNASVTRRPLDQDVKVGFETFEVVDCRQEEHERRDTHALIIEGVSVNMRAAESGSPYAADRVPVSIISAEITHVDAGIRLGLLRELADFGEAVIRYVDPLVNPEQLAHCKRVLLSAEGGSAVAAASSQVAELTKQTIKLDLREVGLRLVPDKEHQEIVSDFRITDVSADVVLESGAMAVKASVGSVVLMHGELPDITAKVLADENVDKVILVWVYDGECVAVDLKQPSPRDTSASPLSLNARLSGLDVMVSAGFLKDVADWALNNPFIDVLQLKKGKKGSHQQSSSSAPASDAVYQAPAILEGTASPLPVEVDMVIEKLAVVIPNEAAVGGLRIGMENLAIVAKTVPDHQDVELKGLAVWTYVGGAHHLRSSHKANRHMIIAEPVNLGVCVRKEDLKRTISVRHPGMFVVRFSYCDLRLLKQLGEFIQTTADGIASAATHASKPEPEPEPELGPEPQPELQLQGNSESSASSLGVQLLTPVRLCFDIYDDAVARNRARLLLGASILIQEISVDSPKIEIGVGLSVHHYDKHGVKCPLVEPLQIAVAMDSAAKTTHVAVQNKIDVVVTEPLLVDLQRVAAVWADKIDEMEAVDSPADYESIVVKNETGADLFFGEVGSPADRKLSAGMQATLSAFETDIQVLNSIHVKLRGKQHGHHDISDCRNPVGDVRELAFRLGSWPHVFIASTSMPCVQHLEQGGRRKNEIDSIVAVDITRQGATNVMQLRGTISVRNGLPDPVHVSVHTRKLTLFESQIEGVSPLLPTGTTCGLPLSVKPDDESATLTIRRGESSIDVRLTEVLHQQKSAWLQFDETWVCLAVRLLLVRSRFVGLAASCQSSDRVCVQKALIDIVPALQIVSLVPEFPLEISYSAGGAFSTYTLEAADGDSSGRPTELLLRGLGCVDDEVAVGAKLVMHGVTYTSSKPCLIHGARGSTLADSMTLSAADKRNLPIKLELLHDILPSGAHVVRIWVAYCLVNSSGQPVMVCRDEDHGKFKFTEDDLPAVRTRVAEKYEPSEVKDWLSHKNGMGQEMSLLPGDGAKLRIRVRHNAGGWSDAFRVDNPGTGGLLEIVGGELGSIQLSVNSTSGNPGSAKTLPWCPSLRAAPPTKFVRLFPRTVISNHTDARLFVAQASTKHEHQHAILAEICELHTQEMTVLEFPQHEGKGANKSMALRLSQDAEWSGAINCDTVQQIPIWLRDGSNGDLLLHITVRTTDNIIFIHIAPESKQSPEFCLRNNIGCSVTVRQTGCEPCSVVRAGETCSLGWDFPERERVFIAEYLSDSGTKTVKIKPDVVGPHPKEPSVCVAVEGGTRVIIFTPSTPNHDVKVKKCGAEKQVETVVVLVDGVGVSLTTTAGLYSRELVAINIGQIKVEINDDPINQTIALTVESLQVDSMLVESPSTPISFPVILRTMTGLEEYGHVPKPALCATTVTRKQSIPHAKHMDAISVLMQEIELQVELSLLVPLLEFMQNMTLQLQLELPDYSQKAEIKRLEFAEFGERNDMDEPILFVRFLQIHPISVKLSFQMGKLQIPPVAKPFAVIAKSFTTIDRSPIKLSSVVINDVCGYKSEVTSKIFMHYVQQAKSQIYKIIGSIGILGDPVGLVNKLGSGVTMFFYEPIQGILQGPGHFIAGLGQGTAFLVAGTVEGAFHAPAEVTAALSQGLSALGDSDSKAGSGQKAHSTMQGLGFMAHDFGHDLCKTVTSIFVAPIKGAKTNGASGFVKGIGKGIVQTGVSGAALGVDLAANLTGALSHLLSNPLGHSNPNRIRLRRVVHRGGVIEHWNETRAIGQALLDVVRVHQAKHLNNTIDVRRKNGPLLTMEEYYNDHFEVANGNVLILANEHILLVKERERGYMDMSPRETRKQKGDKVDLIWSVRVSSIKKAVRTRRYRKSLDCDLLHHCSACTRTFKCLLTCLLSCLVGCTPECLEYLSA